jgi:DNA-binding CsgD family transcriptional regulator
MLNPKGEAPPSRGHRPLTESEVSVRLEQMDDLASRYARVISWKWGWLRPPHEDLKAGVIEIMWTCITNANEQESDEDLERFIRFCVFTQQSRLVAHALGYNHEYQLYQWMKHQKNPASYYRSVPAEETIEATGSDIKRLEDHRFLEHLIQATDLKGIQKEIMQSMMRGLSVKDISDRLDMSIQRISWNKQQALSKLASFAERHNVLYF